MSTVTLHALERDRNDETAASLAAVPLITATLTGTQRSLPVELIGGAAPVPVGDGRRWRRHGKRVAPPAVLGGGVAEGGAAALRRLAPAAA